MIELYGVFFISIIVYVANTPVIQKTAAKKAWIYSSKPSMQQSYLTDLTCN